MLTMEQYEKVNGYPNEFWYVLIDCLCLLFNRAWGGEDDIMSARVLEEFGSFNELPADIGSYENDRNHARDMSNTKENAQKARAVSEKSDRR